MNTLKKLLAAALAVVTVLTFVGCHKKDEIAVTVGDYEFTSAYYMCALFYADADARGIVDERNAEKAEEEGSDATQTEEVDYLKEKIEKKDFADYVKDEAIATIKRVAAYKTKCKEEKVEMDDELKSNLNAEASYYWTNYGYQQMLEPNGVSKETFLTYMEDTYFSSLYFKHLYGEGGEREIPLDKVKEEMNKSFAIANVLNASFTEEDTEDSKAEKKAKLDNYVNSINSGKMTFEQANNDFNGVTAEATPKEENHEGHDHAEGEAETETEENTTPKDQSAQILGSEDTSYESSLFETAGKMAVGEAKIVSEDTGLTLIVKKDIFEDPYYLKTLDMQTRQLISGEDLEKEIEKFAETLDFDENSYATDRFKVKNIKYPEAAQ